MAARRDEIHKDYPPFLKVQSGSKVDVHYSVLYKGIPEELRIRYEDEVNETAENRKQGLCQLKELIKLEELDNLEDTLLLAVLRVSKFNMKKAEAKLRSFIKYRREIVDRLANMDIETIENVLFEDAIIGMLPYRDSGGATIIYTYPSGGAGLDNYTLEEATVCGFGMLLFFLTCELTTFAGISYISDCKTPSLPILVAMVNAFRQYMSHILSYPLRVKKADCFNEIALLRWLVKLLRPIVPEKIYKRVSFNGGCENLQKTYHPDILPEEFGGNLGPLNNKFYRQQVLDYFAQLKAESLQRTAKKSST